MDWVPSVGKFCALVHAYGLVRYSRARIDYENFGVLTPLTYHSYPCNEHTCGMNALSTLAAKGV